MLHLASGQQLANSSTWSPRPQGAPLLHALRASPGSQASMLCMPPTLASSDSNTAAQLPHHERLLTTQVHGIQGHSYPLSAQGSGLRGSHQNARDKTNQNTAPLAPEECLISELQQRLGAAVAAAAAAGATPAHHHLTSPAPPSPSLGWQQQQLHALQQQQQQRQQQERLLTAVSANESQDLQLLAQLCMPHPQQPSVTHEQQAGAAGQYLQPGLLQHLEELQQALLLKQLLQLQQLPPRQTEERTFSHSLAASLRLQHLQQLQQHIQLLQRRTPTGQHHQTLGSGSSLLPGHVYPDEQTKLLILSQQLQQQLQQQPAQQPQLQQHPRPLQQVDAAHLQLQNFPRGTSLGSEAQDSNNWPDAGLEQMQQLQQLQQLQEIAMKHQGSGITLDKLKCLEDEFLQPRTHEISQGVQLLSPAPPPQWAQIPHQQPQQHRDIRIPFGASQCGPSGTSQGVSVVQPPQQQPSAPILNEATAPLTITAAAQPSRGGPSLPVQPGAVEGALHSVAGALAQPSAGGRSDSLAVRKLLEELLRIIGPPAATGAPPTAQRQESHPATPLHAANGEAVAGLPPEDTQQNPQGTKTGILEGPAVACVDSEKVCLLAQIEALDGDTISKLLLLGNKGSTENETGGTAMVSVLRSIGCVFCLETIWFASANSGGLIVGGCAKTAALAPCLCVCCSCLTSHSWSILRSSHTKISTRAPTAGDAVFPLLPVEWSLGV